jgi:hypothetical protein
MKEKQSMKERIISMLNRNAAKLVPPRKAFPNTKHVIKPAFKSGNIWYYEFDDIFNLPYQRGLQAIHSYEELQMKVDRDYLLQHTELIDELLSKSITLDEISRIKAANNQLKERMSWVVIPDQAYKLASVVFFDANEDPTNYDFKYATEKIERWKENEDVESFFLRQRVSKLMPFLNAFDGNFLHYSTLVQEANRNHSKNLYSKFSAHLEKMNIEPSLI